MSISTSIRIPGLFRGRLDDCQEQARWPGTSTERYHSRRSAEWHDANRNKPVQCTAGHRRAIDLWTPTRSGFSKKLCGGRGTRKWRNRTEPTEVEVAISLDVEPEGKGNYRYFCVVEDKSGRRPVTPMESRLSGLLKPVVGSGPSLKSMISNERIGQSSKMSGSPTDRGESGIGHELSRGGLQDWCNV